MDQEVSDELNYWQVAYALGRALDSEQPEFWDVVQEMQKIYPQFAWANTMTDGPVHR